MWPEKSEYMGSQVQMWLVTQYIDEPFAWLDLFYAYEPACICRDIEYVENTVTQGSISPSSQVISHIHGWLQSNIVRFGGGLQLNKYGIRYLHVITFAIKVGSPRPSLCHYRTTHLPELLLTPAWLVSKETVPFLEPSIFRSSRLFEAILLLLCREKGNIYRRFFEPSYDPISDFLGESVDVFFGNFIGHILSVILIFIKN